MDAGGICVARSLPIDAALVRDVLSRLRRDIAGGMVRWTLGARGSAEVDVDFYPVITDTVPEMPAWSSTARLWDRDGVAMLPAVVEVHTEGADACDLVLRPSTPVAPWWAARIPALLELAHATIDELGEEMLWHASRADVATESDFP